jgi:NADH dehydrogenase [ubiquinone] 1 alpha subcomplex assembly factor 7
MKDALRAARVVPAFLSAVSVALVEVSEVLREAQRDALRAAGAGVAWHDRFEDIDAPGPMLVLANEFFDALPIRQVVRADAGWCERCIGLRGEALTFGASPDAIDDRVIAAELRDAPLGSIVEIAPARVALAQAIGARLARQGGAALVIDYGFEGPAVGDTLQAMKAHAFVDVLAEPGRADVTSHVDFTALRQAFSAGGAAVSAVAGQGAFLDRLGAHQRTQVLKRDATSAQAAQLDAAYVRLTGAEAMGTLFKVFCAYSPPALQPAGFSEQ